MPIVGAYGDQDSLTGLHENLRDRFSRLSEDWVCERDDIILDSRAEQVIDDGVETKGLLQERVSVIMVYCRAVCPLPSCQRTYTSLTQCR